MISNEQPVKEIRKALEAWGEALLRKDLDEMHKGYTDDCRTFDIKTSLKGVQSVKELWRSCFPYFDESRIEYKDLEIHATDEMAVVHFRSRLTGTVQPMPEEMANMWTRGTVCHQKIDGVWKCIHEHISFPVDVETLQAAKAA